MKYFAILATITMSLSFTLHGKQTNNTFLLSEDNPSITRETFSPGEKSFLLNGKPFVIKAAELHYPRIPKEYWSHRIELCKALGMNTICLYAFWNSHEPVENQFDFSGQNDIREFILICHDNNLKVILRPGPYVCAEWEMGGLPWWLLKNKDIKLRENDPYFLERVSRFQKALAQQIGDLTIDKGGPIIMIQVENEYGSYGIDKSYISNIRDIIRENFGNNISLFQCDWSSNFLNNGLNDLIWTINFGTGANIDRQFEKLREIRPTAPLMCSEFWSGWFDKWGANHETRSSKKMISGIDEMLSKGISFSLYMTHGGTNWGHWAGANSPGFAPDVTSYDYDAPINENGIPTTKYWELRNLLAKYNDGKKLPDVPKNIPVTSIPRFSFSEVAAIFQNLPECRHDQNIRTMEEYDQGFGSILYRTTLPDLKNGGLLSVNEVHDFARIFINGKTISQLDRRAGERDIVLPPCQKGDTLDILVEAMGRINFGHAIKDFKGITKSVTITEDRNGYKFVCDLKNWEVFNIDDTYKFYTSMNFKPIVSVSRTDNGRLPAGVYRGSFDIKKPADTFLNFETWGKGLVYVNGHPIGRIWEIGPQQTLYMPGCWLKKGKNEIIVFDISGPREAVSEGLIKPKLNNLNNPKPHIHRKEKETLDLTNIKPIYSGEFDSRPEWKTVRFDSIYEGRYLCFEAISSIDGGKQAAIAELYVTDENRERISRELWKADYADSEDIKKNNRSADKLFDLQESTYWSTADTVPYPHAVVIDLGKSRKISALQYLPPMDDKSTGAIKSFKIYLSATPFNK